MRILIQKRKMHSRIGQTLAVMLPMNGNQPGTDVPHHGSGGGHPVNPAAAFSLGIDFTVQQQIIVCFVAAFCQLGFDRIRDVLKGGPDTGLGGSASNQVTGSAVAKNGVDGINQNRLASAGLAGQNIEA